VHFIWGSGERVRQWPGGGGAAGRVLQRLGAEPEWTEGDHDDDSICWTAGPATTFFCVENGPDDTPDLRVLAEEKGALIGVASQVEVHPLPDGGSVHLLGDRGCISASGMTSLP
jgi:hypothetical protein